MLKKTPDPDEVSVGEERLIVDKQVEESGRVRVSTRVEQHNQLVSEHLRSDEFTVERVAVDREVRQLPEIRREGDVLVVPIIEEEIVVTKRLILKEELRIVRRVRTRVFEQKVPLRRVTVAIEHEKSGEANHRPQEHTHGPDDHSLIRHQGPSGGRQASCLGNDRRR